MPVSSFPIRRRRPLASLLATVSLTVAPLMGHAAAPSTPATATASAQGAPLASMVLQLRAVPQVRPLEGVVEAVRQAVVAAQTQGRVVEVLADAGQRVQRGQLLARIDEREAAQGEAAAQAQIAQAEAALINARAAHERAQRLLARQFVSQAAVDQAEAGMRVAEAQWRAAQALRGQAGTQRGFASISAPLAGVIGQRHLEAGELAQPGKPLFTVYDPAGLRVVASLPQSELASLPRQPWQAEVDIPGVGTLRGQSVSVVPLADRQAHVLQLRVELPAREVAALPGLVPGLSARVSLLAGEGARLAVPAQAVLRRGEITAVYVLDAQGYPSLRQVRLGDILPAGELTVLAGVRAGERIALEPVRAGLWLQQNPR